jgi:hypothetical protein
MDEAIIRNSEGQYEKISLARAGTVIEL